MPNYCKDTPEVNSVPPVADMELFKPYFEIPDGCSEFTVYIKCSSSSYRVASTSPGYPSGGPCGSPTDMQQMIYIEASASTGDNVISCTLDYCQDPNGKHINIYVQETPEAGGLTRGHSKSGEMVRQ